MSQGYKTRLKRIRDEKKHRATQGVFENAIPLKDFRYMQAEWDREITGPPIGTLADYSIKLPKII